ncbi:hypothetical protein HBI34_217410 [Parastagonospora nodorum]|nr:hypothetical protein HBI34_217410 [Parastagonospora nodorum]
MVRCTLHLIRELGARHSLLNLSVYNLVEEFARYILSKSVYAVFKCLASSSNLSITIRCRNYSLYLSCLIRLQH